MFRQLKKTLVATVIASLTLGSILPAFADSADTLPDMGTSAGSTLSIGQEMQMGDYYVRQLRGSAPLINDPLLVQYINGLGMRLVSHANSVRTPFHFYLINNDQINAFAFFGGNVVLHSALFRYSIMKASWRRSWRTKFPTSPSAISPARWKTKSATLR
jgi:predicted Zn-dependent protease